VAAVDRIETVVAQAVTQPVNLLEYEAVARGLIPRPQFEFIAGGSGDEISLRGNRAAYGRWRLLPRMMSGVESPSLATTVLGDHVSLPVLVSPMGLHCLAHKDGERATASAVQRAGTIFCLSVAASQSMEEVAPLAGAWWFQLYLLVDRGLSVEHVRRAETAGASAIVLTVDVTVRGRREADERNQFALPPGMSMPNLLPADFEGEVPSYALFTAWDKTISWRDLEWLAGITRLPVVVKGILSPQDALLAVEHGAKAIIVSNHGGRQLDSAVASLDALPAVAAAIGERAEILLDGGIRRGTDVLKALALGARAVMAGRPVLYALAAGGEDGVLRAFDLLRNELITDMILSGVQDVTAIPRGLVVPDGPRLSESPV
jgi:4-hydroxymandelate oxidase